jgi:glycine cleavage system aminomethyltransferase T
MLPFSFPKGATLKTDDVETCHHERQEDSSVRQHTGETAMSSNSVPSAAKTVIIGGGMVGNSLAYHLARMGREDIAILDKGPLPDPGGSTGHVSNFLMPVEHSKEMTHLTRRSIEQYKDMDTFTNSGGIEVARTEERVEELKRRIQSAKAWGEPAELLTPEEVEALVPYVNTDLIEAGFYSTGAGTCDPLRAGEVMRARAEEYTEGGLHVSPNAEVLDLHVKDGSIQAVETDRETITADEVVIAAGLWSPKIAEMADVDIPLTPAVHQMVSVGPISFFEDYEGEISFPVVRDMGFSIFDFRGSDVVDYLERMAVGRIDVDVGKTVYTPILAENGGFVSDLTIARLGPEHYRVVTGGAAGGSDRAWFGGHIPDDADVTMIDRSESLCTLGVWGPNARGMVDSVTEEDMSHDAFEPYTAQEITVGEVDAWAMRLSYIGEQGWEIYAPMGQGRRLWDVLWEAGQDHDVRPAGMGVYGTTGRLEKGYRLFGHELELEYNPAEAGLTFHGVKDADFIGKEAYAEAIDEENTATLCTLSVDDHAPEGGERRFMLGNEPILDGNGDVLVDDEGRRSYVTSAGTGPSVGKHLLMAYLPQSHAEEGQSLQVEYMGQQYPVTVEVVGSRPLFDPENERIRS